MLCIYIVATHFVTRAVSIVEVVRLVSLHLTAVKLYVISKREAEESAVRNAVGLIACPLLGTSVTVRISRIGLTVAVSVDKNGHILALDDMLNGVNSGVGSLYVNTAVEEAVVVLVIRILSLRIGNDGNYLTVTDSDRSIGGGIYGNLGYSGVIVLNRSTDNVTVFINVEHLLHIIATVCVFTVTDKDSLIRVLYLDHARRIKGHTDIGLSLGETVGLEILRNCNGLACNVRCYGKHVYTTERAVVPTDLTVIKDEGRAVPIRIGLDSDGLCNSAYVVGGACSSLYGNAVLVSVIMRLTNSRRVIGNTVTNCSVLLVGYVFKIAFNVIAHSADVSVLISAGY